MFEVAMKSFRAVRGAMGGLVMLGLGALLLTGLFTGFGAGQAGGALGIVGRGCWRTRCTHARNRKMRADRNAVPMSSRAQTETRSRPWTLLKKGIRRRWRAVGPSLKPRFVRKPRPKPYRGHKRRRR